MGLGWSGCEVLLGWVTRQKRRWRIALLGDNLPHAILKLWRAGIVPVQECNSGMAMDAQVSCQKGLQSSSPHLQTPLWPYPRHPPPHTQTHTITQSRLCVSRFWISTYLWLRQNTKKRQWRRWLMWGSPPPPWTSSSSPSTTRTPSSRPCATRISGHRK